jgi:hypothetical protein
MQNLEPYDNPLLDFEQQGNDAMILIVASLLSNQTETWWTDTYKQKIEHLGHFEPFHPSSEFAMEVVSSYVLFVWDNIFVRDAEVTLEQFRMPLLIWKPLVLGKWTGGSEKRRSQ